MKVLEEFGAYFRNLLQDKIIEEDMIASGELLNDLDYIVEIRGAKAERTKFRMQLL